MLSSYDWFEPKIITRVNKEERWSASVKLNVASAMAKEANFQSDYPAWIKIRVYLLQRAPIDNDGSSVTTILEASREAQFELADDCRDGCFGLRDYALKACAYYSKAGAPLCVAPGDTCV